jgi:hypothetical protein
MAVSVYHRHHTATRVRGGDRRDTIDARDRACVRAPLAANEAVDRLHNARLEGAKDDEERERIARPHREVILTLAAILHKEQCGPPSPAPTGLRLVRRDAG